MEEQEATPAPEPAAPPPDEGEGGVDIGAAIDELEGKAPPKKTAKTGDEPVEEAPAEDLPDESDGTGAGADLVEVEVEGAKYTVPKALEGAILRQSDYGTKMLEVDEKAKAVQTQEKHLAEFAQVLQENRGLDAQIASIDSQLHDYEQVDWDTLRQNDPDEFLKHQRHEMQLRHTREQLVHEITAKSQQRAAELEAKQAEIEQSTRAVLARDIPNWGPQLQKDLSAAAAAVGLPVDRVEQALKLDPDGPALVKVLHKAWKYDQLVSKHRSASKGKPQEATPAARVGTGRQSTSNAKPSDKDDPEVWREKREREIAAKRKRA